MEVENVFGIVKAILILPAVFWLVGRFGMPVKYWQDDRRSPDPDRMALLPKWKFYSWCAVLFIGMMFIAYDAADAIMDWMPRSWGGVDEDGEWRAIRPTFQIMLAFLIAGSVAQIAGDRAEAAAKWPTDHGVTLAVIEDLERPVYQFERDQGVDGYRLRLIRSTRSILSKERYDDSYDLKEYRSRLLERLAAVEKQIEDARDQ